VSDEQQEGHRDDWLTRLSAGDWMRAALVELEQAYAALAGKRYREGLAHARRAAGMGINAQLRVMPVADPAYGQSYMEHLHRLAVDPAIPEPIRAAALRLHHAPPSLSLVTLGPGSVALADAARAILVHVADHLPADVS
jgi:hypothetical protein